MTETVRFEPLPGGGTRLHDAIRVHFPLPRPLRRLVARYIFFKQLQYDQVLLRVARLAESQGDLAAPVPEAESALQEA